MTPRLEPRIARQAEVDTQCRHCSGGGACLLSGHQLPNHESPSLTSSTGGEAIAPDGGIAVPGPGRKKTNNLGLLTWRETRCDSVPKVQFSLVVKR
jgi:hypothetical protein